MDPVVSVAALSRRYGDVTALDALTFEVEPGTCVAVLGPNGAGKSTLFSILATLRRPDEGDAAILGDSVTHEPARVRHGIGVLFQEPLVSKHLRAREVLLHHAALYGVPRRVARERAEELLRFVGLDTRAEDRTSSFSGGMKRRLDLARVLMTEPRVLLLDEPTAGLDLRGRQEVQAKVRALIEGGTTVLLATHDLDEAARLASRVLLLDRGRLLADDTPSRLAGRVGRRVVRVSFTPETLGAALPAARKALEGLGETVETGDGLELLLPAADDGEVHVSPGAVVDALEEAGAAYDRVTVREPDLGDVFLGLTGRPLTAPEGDQGEEA